MHATSFHKHYLAENNGTLDGACCFGMFVCASTVGRVAVTQGSVVSNGNITLWHVTQLLPTWLLPGEDEVPC